MTRPISLTVNGRSVEAAVEPRTHLADFVRDALGLTGTHLGCEHGVCGACTVLIDGTPMRSCIAYAIACDGAEVRTIEGFDEDPLMQALRDAFTRHHALQCGYCTPGMLVTAYDIIRRLPAADEARVREELSGNLCRCTGYVGIVEAVRSVLDEAPVVDRVVQREAVFPPTVIAHTQYRFRTTRLVTGPSCIVRYPERPRTPSVDADDAIRFVPCITEPRRTAARRTGTPRACSPGGLRIRTQDRAPNFSRFTVAHSA